MFDILLSCKKKDILSNLKVLSISLKDEKEAELLIRTLWKRVPELSDEEEKEIHKVGRKIRKRFHMKPVVID